MGVLKPRMLPFSSISPGSMIGSPVKKVGSAIRCAFPSVKKSPAWQVAQATLSPAANSPLGSVTGRGVRNSTSPRLAIAGSKSSPGRAGSRLKRELELGQGVELALGRFARGVHLQRGHDGSPGLRLEVRVPPVPAEGFRACQAEKARRLAVGDLPLPDRADDVRPAVGEALSGVAGGAGQELARDMGPLTGLLTEDGGGEEQLLALGDELLPLLLGPGRRRVEGSVPVTEVLPEGPDDLLVDRVQRVGGEDRILRGVARRWFGGPERTQVGQQGRVRAPGRGRRRRPGRARRAC